MPKIVKEISQRDLRYACNQKSPFSVPAFSHCRCSNDWMMAWCLICESFTWMSPEICRVRWSIDSRGASSVCWFCLRPKTRGLPLEHLAVVDLVVKDGFRPILSLWRRKREDQPFQNRGREFVPVAEVAELVANAHHEMFSFTSKIPCQQVPSKSMSECLSFLPQREGRGLFEGVISDQSDKQVEEYRN